MNIFPAIDLIGGRAVRLLRGDYDRKTVYSDRPVAVASEFRKAGAEYLHLVDLDGAKSGGAENMPLIAEIVRQSGLKVEVGGGVRTEETVARYLEIGAFRVILGTAAVSDRPFLEKMIGKYGDKIAVGVDVRDGVVATHGWQSASGVDGFAFIAELEKLGTNTVICTDIARDGARAGTNLELYRKLSEEFSMNFVASGGVGSLADVAALRDMKLYGAILGRALYEGDVKLSDAIATAAGETEAL